MASQRERAMIHARQRKQRTAEAVAAATEKRRQTLAAKAARQQVEREEAARKLAEKEARAAQSTTNRLASAKAYRAAHPHLEICRKRGITEADYVALLESQGGRCAICGTLPHGPRLDLDHDHASGKVRGFLCHDCNQLLARAHDSVARLEAAIIYLKHAAD